MIDIGGAINQGLVGYRDTTKYYEDRQARQQQLTQQQELFRMQQESHASQQQSSSVNLELLQQQLQQTQAQTKELVNQMTKQNLYTAFDGGTLADLNHVIKTDKNIQSLIPGIDSIESVDMTNQAYANQSQGMVNPVLATSVRDGQIVREVKDLEAFKIRTGYSNYKLQKDTELNKVKASAAMIQAQSNQLSNLGPNATAEQIAEVTNPLLPKDKLAAETSLAKTRMRVNAAAQGDGKRDALKQAETAFINSNPSATPDQIKQFYADWTTKNLEGVGSVRETQDLKTLNTEQTAAQAVQPTKVPEAELRGMENKIFAKLDEKKKKAVQEDVDKMKSNYHLANNLTRVLAGSKSIDKDALADSKTWVESKLGRESKQTYANIDFNTRGGIVLANFMKEMSGAAVSDAEVQRLKGILMGGDLTDEIYVKSAIATFADEIKQQNVELGSTLKDTAPHSVSKYAAKRVSAADFD